MKVVPIHSPDHKGREGDEILCERCGRPFRRWKINPNQRFCTKFCANRAAMTAEPSDELVVPLTAAERDLWLDASRRTIAESERHIAELEAMTFDDAEVAT